MRGAAARGIASASASAYDRIAAWRSAVAMPTPTPTDTDRMASVVSTASEFPRPAANAPDALVHGPSLKLDCPRCMAKAPHAGVRTNVLASAPLIEMLDETQQRRPPYPLTWSQQGQLVPALAQHLQRPVLFALNTGARDDNVCGLQWKWEVPVPELKGSVFVVPAAEFKGKRDHVLVLNDAAWSIVEACRGQHAEYVFVYRRERVKHLDREPAMTYQTTRSSTRWTG